MKKICLIIGMGRSGTSLLAGVLKIIGVDFSMTQPSGGKENPKGYFEDFTITGANEKLLGGLRSTPAPEWSVGKSAPWQWLDPVNITDEDLKNLDMSSVDELISSRYRRDAFYGLKDPRITLFLPRYLDLFKRLGFEVSLIHIQRNPEEVAGSLFKFHNFQVPHDQAVGLCKRYNEDAIKYTSDRKVFNITHSEIMNDGLNKSKELAEFLSLDLTDGKIKEIKDFIDPALYRNKVER